MYDVMIIGAGVVGAAIARELSKYEADVCVLEKEEDVCCGTSKANSGIIHAGYDAKSGTLKAQLNVQGNAMMEALSKELGFPFERRGSLVVCEREEEMDKLHALYERGLENNVPGLRILKREEAKEMEPNLKEEIAGALFAPTAGIVCPFLMNLAFAENASENGVEFRFQEEVKAISREKEFFKVITERGAYETKYIINAAGVYADVIHNMVHRKRMMILPRKGEYLLLDKAAGSHVGRTIFALPGKTGKGVLVTPTIHGNLLVGPTASDAGKEDVSTTKEGTKELLEKGGLYVKRLPFEKIITTFAGLRAHGETGDFIIGESEEAPGFINCAAIESPGLSCAPAIGAMAAEIVKRKLAPGKKRTFKKERKGILKPSEMTSEKRNALIQEKPEYGNIICRCEQISEGEIMEAIHGILGAKSLDGVKRRVRAGMGRCQGGFCSPRVTEILARELQIPVNEVTKSGGEGKILLGRSK